ncbi:rna binding domain-containing protein [Lasallia pustulata]|uniref:Rna binding domain-containing protein n=1 Tax=Lasallia pustulata TaxID=136370 RepID=A0A1W5D1D2_9LECA|nr:rna binding domain-containing protein [Lasallia pustulata]
MRGQAHIVFRDIQASTQAMRALQGFDFFSKEMKIQYARGKSDTIAKLDGTYRLPTAATAAVTSTELQQSIFNAPPSAITPAPSSTTTSVKPSEAGANGVNPDTEGPRGLKRGREDEEEEEGAPMDEDDDDVSMEASSDEE